jgi:hypothetical protein
MIARTLIRLLCGVVLCGAAPALAAPDIDPSWPPDPKLYDPPGTEIVPGLAVGHTLDETNATLAEKLLPPEILAHYAAGDYKNSLFSWPTGMVRYAKSFEQATAENDGKYGIEPGTGTIVDRESGKPPDYIYGIPFPKISPEDPQAGIKALWNQFHVFWHQGNTHAETLIVWVRRGGVDRQSTQDSRVQFYENQMPPYRIPNPQGFSSQFISITTSPADLQGTVAMSYRYRDPKKRDSMWTYLPALRRVRSVSPANRSDGFLGSDLSHDDGHFFDGKPEDFVWKTVGLREALGVVDPASIRGDTEPLRWLSTGGWHSDWPADLPAAGYMKEGWKGLAWAPVSGGLAKRKFWVVEGVPRDTYYLYGRLELWIDAESWSGAYNRKFSWKGDLLNSYAVMEHLNRPATRAGAPEVEWLPGSRQAWQCAENVKMQRATLAGVRARPDGPLDRRVTHDVSRLFSLHSLEQHGK